MRGLNSLRKLSVATLFLLRGTGTKIVINENTIETGNGMELKISRERME